MSEDKLQWDAEYLRSIIFLLNKEKLALRTRKREVLVDDIIIAMKKEFVVCMMQTVRGSGGPIC